jgi:hypothetical protein
MNIRMGYVTQLDFVRYGQEGEVTEKYEHIFGISAVVSEGDSGSPVLFVRDGNLTSSSPSKQNTKIETQSCENSSEPRGSGCQQVIWV